jgi:hypothetical protein
VHTVAPSETNTRPVYQNCMLADMACMSSCVLVANQGAGLAMGEEATLNELLRQKEELIRERDTQVDQIMALRAEVMETQVQHGD